MYQRICKQCLKAFEAKRTNAYYCSPACRMAKMRNVSVTEKPVTDNLVTDNATDSEITPEVERFRPNWLKLHQTYPKQIKNRQDAIRLMLYTVMEDHPTAVFILGNRLYTKHKENLKVSRPEYLDSFK